MRDRFAQVLIARPVKKIAALEVGIVSTLREVILRGALHIEWQVLLVLCAFLLTLGLVLRYSGIRYEKDSVLPKLAPEPATQMLRFGESVSAQ